MLTNLSTLDFDQLTDMHLDSRLEQLGDVSNLIRHELRTPLTSIHGVLRILRDHYSQSSKAEEKLIQMAITSANRLIRLADALEEDSCVLRSMVSAQDMEDLRLEYDLSKGLENQEFSLQYQPIYCTQKNKVTGFEALARWQHPVRGSISPDVFIPLAERSGFICQLGRYLIEQVCQALQHWNTSITAYESPSISINLSTVQLSEPDFCLDIKKLLDEYKIQPGKLIVEITESTLIDNHKVVLENIFFLKEIGINIYLDDFGTGYSSLSRLQDLPFDAIKIDKSFVVQQNWSISKAILMLAEGLQLDVIAEGIETAEQLKTLKELGCTKMQGFYFSKPVEFQAASQLLEPVSK
jgi:EAL domain-containing protein (putative c-di-GMP-specific phosphodiesterase class I)